MENLYWESEQLIKLPPHPADKFIILKQFYTKSSDDSINQRIEDFLVKLSKHPNLFYVSKGKRNDILFLNGEHEGMMKTYQPAVIQIENIEELYDVICNQIENHIKYDTEDTIPVIVFSNVDYGTRMVDDATAGRDNTPIDFGVFTSQHTDEINKKRSEVSDSFKATYFIMSLEKNDYAFSGQKNIII